GRGRDPRPSRPARSDQLERRARRHDPRRLRHRHRAQRRARIGRAGDREDRDLLLLRRRRDPRPCRGALIATFSVTAVTGTRLLPQAARGFARNDLWMATGAESRSTVGRALRNHNVWLALAYASLMLLLTRTYA